MEILDFKHLILNKDLPNFVILTGDECLRYIYLEEIYKRFKVKRLYDIENYFNIINSKFNNVEEGTIFIIYNDEKFKSDMKWWKQKFKNLILIYDKLEKKDKLFKAFEKDIVNFLPLDDTLLVGLLKNRLDLPKEYLQLIVQRCESNYFKCINEANKLSIFNKSQHLDLLNEFARDKIFCRTDSVGSFDFVNAFTNREKKQCIEIINKLNKDDAIGQLALVYNSLKNELLVRGSNGQTAEELGINPKLYYVLSRKRYFTVEELCKILVNIGNKIRDIKMGVIENTDALYLSVLENL